MKGSKTTKKERLTFEDRILIEELLRQNYKLKYSRIGIDMSIGEVEYWNDYFKDKIIDKNQPILHIFKNIEDQFPKSI